MATPPGFYNPVDQAIYSAGDFFIPQERFRAAPYSVNNPATDDPTAAGISAVYRPQGGGGGGGVPFTGGISDLTTAFQKSVDDRQNRLTELNRPMREIPGEIIPGVRGDDILMENLQGYVGKPDDYFGIEEYNEALQKYSGMEGPQTIKGAPGIFTRGEPTMEKPTLNRRISDAFYSLPFLSKPQTAEMIMQEGYTGSSSAPGIIGMMAGMVDKYGSLPRPDQAFIAANMGYTGPTVFGENQSGLGKDPFGLNVRSAFGNYAERVGTEATKLGDLLGKTQTERYGKGTSGISFNPATGMFEAIDDDDEKAKKAALKATQMNKMNIAKFNYYTQKTRERNEFREQEKRRQEEAFQAQLNREQRSQRQRDLSTIEQAYRDFASGRDDGYASGSAGVQSDGSYNDPFDPGGGEKDGGFIDGTNRRMDFMGGGLADLVDIYD